MNRQQGRKTGSPPHYTSTMFYPTTNGQKQTTNQAQAFYTQQYLNQQAYAQQVYASQHYYYGSMYYTDNQQPPYLPSRNDQEYVATQYYSY